MESIDKIQRIYTFEELMELIAKCMPITKYFDARYLPSKTKRNKSEYELIEIATYFSELIKYMPDFNNYKNLIKCEPFISMNKKISIGITDGDNLGYLEKIENIELATLIVRYFKFKEQCTVSIVELEGSNYNTLYQLTIDKLRNLDGTLKLK